MVQRKRRLSFAIVLAMILTMFSSSVMVFAETKIQAEADEQAKRALTQHVQTELSQNSYGVEGGGVVSGADLFEGSANEGYDLNEDEFGKLSSKAQTDVVEDIAESSREAIDNDDVDSGNVTEATVQNWWRELQTKKGVGSKFLNEILKNTKPDFVRANQIYQPFSGPVSITIAVIAVITMALLGIVIVSDIAYIVLPPVRMLVADKDSNGRPEKSKIFSYDAIYAVECAENNSDGGSGGGKQALGIYLKRRIVALIILGICLLYLVQGQIYVLVGYILDIVSGFLGF